MSIKKFSGYRQAFTLVELMVASALALMAATVIAFFSYFTSRSFVAATNYTDMNMASRRALDQMSMTIRGSDMVTAYSSNSITLLDPSNNIIQFTFSPSTRTLNCISNGQTTAFLTDCDSLSFWLYQRTPISNTFDCYLPADVYSAKLVQVTWSCSRTILGAKVNTEMMESAKICMRNQYHP
jgi:prepilin-type N-terminal cleavage/methylation domain-containing protein